MTEKLLWQVGAPGFGADDITELGPLFLADVDQITVRPAEDGWPATWPRLQPGPLCGWGGLKPKTISVEFDLVEPAPAGLRLDARLWALQGPPPDLDISINTATGRYFLAWQQRPDRSGFSAASDLIEYCDLAVHLPADLLRVGRNVLSLTTVATEELSAVERRPPHPEYATLWGSSLRYQHVALSVASAPPDATPAPQVEPLPLYVQRDGVEHELVDVTLNQPGPAGYPAEEVTLRVAGHDYAARVEPGGRRHGQARARVSVAAFAAGQSAELIVGSGADLRTYPLQLTPARRWTIHLLPHVHLDLGFTDYPAKTFEVHTRNVDRVLDILDQDPAYAYSADGSAVISHFLSGRSAQRREKLLAAMRAGRVSANAFTALFYTGVASLEECFRSAYPMAELRRDADVAMDYANLTDVPSYSGAMPSILAALGLRHFLGIQNHARAGNQDTDQMHRRSPFLWEGPDGSRVLTVFADGYAQLNSAVGYPASTPGLIDAAIRFNRRFDHPDFAPTDLAIVGFYSDNSDLGTGDTELARRFGARFSWPRVVYNTFGGYLDAVEACRDELPVVRGDGGSYWEDGLGAAAATVARYRRAQTALPAAETASALLAAQQPGLAAPVAELDRGWRLLFLGAEHTWTSVQAVDHPDGEQTIDQLDWKEHQIHGAARIAIDEGRRALSQLGELIATDGPSVVVFNPLSWSRSDVVEVDAADLGPTAVVDPDGTVVPSDRYVDPTGADRLRFRAADVPGLGYRCYGLRPSDPVEPAEPEEQPPASSAAAEVITAGRYQVRVESGRIVSLRHRQTGRELLDPASAYGFAEPLYVSGGGTAEGRGRDAERTTLWDAISGLPAPELTITAAQLRYAGTRHTPWGAVVSLIGAAPTVPALRVDVECRDDTDRVDVTVRLTKEPERAKEALYLAFPFAVADPTLRYDRQLGWVDPAVDHFPGAANEWFTTQFGVSLSNAEHGVLWTSHDAPLFAMSDVVRGTWAREFLARDATVLSWVMNNYWWVNFPASQSGPLTLRYSVCPTGAFAEPEAARLGREARSGLLAGRVSWLDKLSPRGAKPAAGEPLLRVAEPGTVALTVATPRVPGADLLVRAQQLAPQPATATISVPGRSITRAQECTATEDARGELPLAPDGSLTVELTGHAVRSILLTLA